MQYKCTQLKDSLTSPIGTVFIICGIEEEKFYDVWQLQADGSLIKLNYRCPIGGHLDNPEWFKKEIYKDSLIDLKCPKCGNTEGEFFSTKYCNHNYEDDDYGVQFAVGIECICGHKRILYGTHYGINKLKKEL